MTPEIIELLGHAAMTVVCSGSTVIRRDVTPEEAARVAVGITIQHGGHGDAA
jgi:hypothetical protein